MDVNSIIQRSSGYKPFIDGLRAVSILAVVAYHVGIASVTGGFVGVDVFFVISGFLIVSHLLSAVSSGRFSFGEFWARRAMRILPPYLLVLVSCMVVAPFILVLPKELIEFGNQSAYSAVMVVNHYFLSQQGYFDGASDTKPLLHLWSLSVEEQFYIVAPVLIFLLYKICAKMSLSYARCFAAFSVFALFFISLVLCIELSGGGAGKNYSFFLMPLRAWEFIAGGVIAFLVPCAKNLHRLILEVLGLLGSIMIGYAVFSYSGKMIYPSWLAALPVFGAAIVILCGIANPKIVIARVLAAKPLVALGLVSYAWYLWHWPLLTFGRIYNFGERILPFDVSMAAISLLLAWGTYVFVDKNVLSWRKRLVNGLRWKHSLVAIIFCLPVCAAGFYMSERYAPAVAERFTEAQVPKLATRAGVCDLHFISSSDACVEKARSKQLGLLIGDSHADASYRQISNHATSQGAVVATLSSGGCASILNVHINNPDLAMQDRCEKGRNKALGFVEKGMNPDFAILFSSWTIYGGRASYSLSEPGSTKPFPDTRQGFVSKLKETYGYLRAKGVKRILVVGPVPIFTTLAPQCVLRSDRYGVDRDKHCSVSRDFVDSARKDVVLWLKESTNDELDVRFIDPVSEFCDKEICRSYGAEGALYVDTNHIADAGMERIYNSSVQDFKWVFGTDLVGDHQLSIK